MLQTQVYCKRREACALLNHAGKFSNELLPLLYYKKTLFDFEHLADAFRHRATARQWPNFSDTVDRSTEVPMHRFTRQ